MTIYPWWDIQPEKIEIFELFWQAPFVLPNGTIADKHALDQHHFAKNTTMPSVIHKSRLIDHNPYSNYWTLMNYQIFAKNIFETGKTECMISVSSRIISISETRKCFYLLLWVARKYLSYSELSWFLNVILYLDGATVYVAGGILDRSPEERTERGLHDVGFLFLYDLRSAH